MKLNRWILLSSVTVLALTIASCTKEEQLDASDNDIVIATMFAPNQGATQAQVSYQVAAKLAADELNAQYVAQSSDFRVKLVQGDLGANPDVALENLKKLYAQGIRLVVGPAESLNLISLTEFANDNGMIIVSNASSAPTLADVDSVHRLVPTDILQTRLLAKKIKADGFTKMVIVSRNDLYGQDFRDHLKSAFESNSIGGQVVGEMSYEPTATVFTQQVELLRDTILATAAPINPATTALVAVSFEEIVPLVKEMIAKDATRFGAFRWYGGDGVAQISEITADASVAQFLLNANFLSTSPYVLDAHKPKLDNFYTRLQAAVPGTPPSVYAALTHDGVTLLAKTMEDIKKNNKEQSSATLKSTLASVAAGYVGITGNLALNAQGDRASLPYALFGLQGLGSPTTYSWVFKGLLTE